MSVKKKKIRENFAAAVFKRDNYKCVFCTVKINLDAHHITDRNLMPNGGYVKENGITLCEQHHIDAEKFHISDGQEWVEGMHPSDLYAKVGSSYEQAVEASKRLK